MSVRKFNFYYAQGRTPITSRWTTDTRALEYAAELSDQCGCTVEVWSDDGARETLEAIYDPDE